MDSLRRRSHRRSNFYSKYGGRVWKAREGVVAHNKEELRKCGITHVLNAAHAAWGSKGSQDFYGKEIHYYGIAAEDSTDFDLSIHFHPASKYIHEVLSAPNGKILVHCILGKSRSATLVLAYLMICHNFSLADAIERVLQHRAISPNRGFLKQLQDLDLELRYKINLCQLL
ncbi:dual specificity protein phosphatase 26-like [Hemicordylus capensis]|uniref:dual specificity protein phosphatase 26-like n=1 Tax=Hemicordylus capensis TaxID=884348 RepID=UPI002303FEDF|nr:dual specificity protein phosphatase 26-like [Hemicordylus capensis]